MKILLDTHTFVWMVDDPNQLSPLASSLLRDRGNTLLLSAVSIWEMQIKIGLNKLPLSRPLREIVTMQQDRNDLQILRIELPHLWALEELPPHHKDPFDRLLIAQAQIEDVPLLSRDELVSQYEIKVLW